MKTVDMEGTGIKIDMMRKERKLSVADIMDKVGFSSPNTFSKWRRGISMPTIDNLVALADIFGCEIGDIVMTKNI